MLFSELVEAVLENEMRPIIERLLEQKALTPEMGTAPRIDRLNEYIDMKLITLKAMVEALPRESKADWNKLNELFLSIIN